MISRAARARLAQVLVVLARHEASLREPQAHQVRAGVLRPPRP